MSSLGAMDPRGAFHVGWTIGICELAVDLLTMSHGCAPQAAGPLNDSVARVLHDRDLHVIVAQARPLIPGAPPDPRTSPELWAFAAHARSWISTNLDPASVVARCLRTALAGSQLVRATHLLLSIPDPGWIPLVRLDPIAAAAAAAGEVRQNLAWATGYGRPPEPLTTIGAHLGEALGHLDQIMAQRPPWPHVRATAQQILTAWMGLPAHPQLQVGLAQLPADGGPWSTRPAAPPGVSAASSASAFSGATELAPAAAAPSTRNATVIGAPLPDALLGGGGSGPPYR